MSQYSHQARALAVLWKALDCLDAMPGSPAKTAQVRELAEELSRLNARAAEIRKAEVLRIRDEEQLSLAPLADRVGISKARAGQIVKAEERRQEQEARNA